MKTTTDTCAVVLGLCAHGLATARSLNRAGIEVHALEQDPTLPGCKTNSAQLHFVDSLKDTGLIDGLLALASRSCFSTPPIIFPINDNMTRTLGEHWDQLSPFYRLPWAKNRKQLLPLLEKDALAHRCAQTSLLSPKTITVTSLSELSTVIESIEYPIFVKPSRPLARFKVYIAQNSADLTTFLEQFQSDFPILLQEYISGPDTNLVFCALYLDNGRVVSHFEGRKLRSIPKETKAWTAIAESNPDERVYKETVRFFDGLGFSGPVSAEYKWSNDGKLYFIEATVGRTDFWLGCCIDNGINFPLITYHHMMGFPHRPSSQVQRAIWYNTERDPFGPLLILKQKGISFIHLSSTFPYYSRGDLGPFFEALRKTRNRITLAMLTRAKKFFPSAKKR